MPQVTPADIDAMNRRLGLASRRRATTTERQFPLATNQQDFPAQDSILPVSLVPEGNKHQLHDVLLHLQLQDDANNSWNLRLPQSESAVATVTAPLITLLTNLTEVVPSMPGQTYAYAKPCHVANNHAHHMLRRDHGDAYF